MKPLVRTIVRVSATLLAAIGLILLLFYRAEIPVNELEITYLTPESRYVSVHDATLHIRQRGSGPVILLLHGSFSSLHTWDSVERQLAAQGFSTLSVDLPGHGLTGPNSNENYSLKYYATLMWALADSLNLDTLAIVGNSMGGSVALMMAHAAPHRVSHLILVDAAWKTEAANASSPWIFKLLGIKPVAKLLTRFTPRFLFRMNLKEVYKDQTLFTERTLDRYYSLVLREGNRKATLQRLQSSNDLSSVDLNQLTIPSLVLWGEEDRWIHVSTGQFLQRELPNSKLVTIPQCGHVPMEEKPRLTAQHMISFLSEFR